MLSSHVGLDLHAFHYARSDLHVWWWDARVEIHVINNKVSIMGWQILFMVRKFIGTSQTIWFAVQASGLYSRPAPSVPEISSRFLLTWTTISAYWRWINELCLKTCFAEHKVKFKKLLNLSITLLFCSQLQITKKQFVAQKNFQFCVYIFKRHHHHYYKALN